MLESYVFVFYLKLMSSLHRRFNSSCRSKEKILYMTVSLAQDAEDLTGQLIILISVSGACVNPVINPCTRALFQRARVRARDWDRRWQIAILGKHSKGTIVTKNLGT